MKRDRIFSSLITNPYCTQVRDLSGRRKHPDETDEIAMIRERDLEETQTDFEWDDEPETERQPRLFSGVEETEVEASNDHKSEKIIRAEVREKLNSWDRDVHSDFVNTIPSPGNPAFSRGIMDEPVELVMNNSYYGFPHSQKLAVALETAEIMGREIDNYGELKSIREMQREKILSEIKILDISSRGKSISSLRALGAQAEWFGPPNSESQGAIKQYIFSELASINKAMEKLEKGKYFDLIFVEEMDLLYSYYDEDAISRFIRSKTIPTHALGETIEANLNYRCHDRYFNCGSLHRLKSYWAGRVYATAFQRKKAQAINHFDSFFKKTI